MGKFFPMISQGPGVHIRANFGDQPFAYGVPSLSAEEIQNALKPTLARGYSF